MVDIYRAGGSIGGRNSTGKASQSQSGVLRGSKHYDQLIKLVLIGDSNVGKTCLLMRFSEDKFVQDHMPTIGIDFKIKMMVVEDVRIKLQLWDTAGQERFQTVTANYYKGAEGVLLVYDSTDPMSFNNVRNWLKQIEQNAEPDILKILVGNKKDLLENMKESGDDSSMYIDEAQGRKLAEEFNMEFYQTSAETGENVEGMFSDVCSKVITKTKLKKEAALNTAQAGHPSNKNSQRKVNLNEQINGN